MSTYTKSVDVEGGIKAFLRANITPEITVNIGDFGNETPARAIKIERQGSHGIEEFNPIDNARILIVCREESKKKAGQLYNTVRDLINRKGGYLAGDVQVMRSVENSGPTGGRDENTGDPITIGYFAFTIREV